MNKVKAIRVRIILSIIIILVAIFRFIFFDILSEKMDYIFLILIVLAVLILFLPWERISSIKAAGIEITLNQPQVRGAIKSLGLNRLKNEKLREIIMRKASEIELLKGSRILWIDDHPYSIIGERWLLRALGAEVVSVTSSEMAEEVLKRDIDFDMIISDVQRLGESYKETGGIRIHEGVNFIIRLRKHKDPIIKTLPVTFYAVYDWDRLVKFTRPAREFQPEAKISNIIEDLLIKVISTLSDVRSNPMIVGLKWEKEK